MLPVIPLNTYWIVLYFLYQYVWENPLDYKTGGKPRNYHEIVLT